jgi:hypothetical protein
VVSPTTLTVKFAARSIFDDMGPQTLKNIAELMRAWRVRIAARLVLQWVDRQVTMIPAQIIEADLRCG